LAVPVGKDNRDNKTLSKNESEYSTNKLSLEGVNAFRGMSSAKSKNVSNLGLLLGIHSLALQTGLVKTKMCHFSFSEQKTIVCITHMYKNKIDIVFEVRYIQSDTESSFNDVQSPRIELFVDGGFLSLGTRRCDDRFSRH
jgi:hypothetical protein